MTKWFETTEGLWAKLWRTLAEGVENAGHPARRPTFATVSPDGWPEARTVVLRTADPHEGIVAVHTDLHSDKMNSLQASPRAALHVWVPEDDLQIRLQAEVTIVSGEATRLLWQTIPDHAQQSYGVVPPPGTPIKDALDYVKSPDPDTFAVLSCEITAVDLVHLGAAHRRAQFSRVRHWQGQWLSP